MILQTDEFTGINSESVDVTINSFLNTANFTKYGNYKDVIAGLLQKHETIIMSLRKNINVYDGKTGTEGTANFLINLLQQHEAIADILRRNIDSNSQGQVN